MEKDMEVLMADQIEDPEEESLVIKFKKPYIFEGKSYTEIDLSGMDDLTGADMIAGNKIMKKMKNPLTKQRERNIL